MIELSKAIMASKGVQVAGGATLLADVLNIDFFRRELVKIGPRSDPEALEQMARFIMTALGLDGTPVIGPPDPKDWNYFTIDVRKARAFWHKEYRSANNIKGAIAWARKVPARVSAGSATYSSRGRR